MSEENEIAALIERLLYGKRTSRNFSYIIYRCTLATTAGIHNVARKAQPARWVRVQKPVQRAGCTKACMAEKDRVIAAIERITAKRDAATDPASRRYYELCLIGWRQHLKRLG